MFKMVGFCAEWAHQNGKGGIHLAAVTTSGLEGEYTNKFKAGQTQRKPGQNLPSIHFQSPEEAELFGEFVTKTSNGEHWIALATLSTNIKVRAIKTTAEGSVAEACCYFLRLLQHGLEKQGIIMNQGEYREADAPEGEYYCKSTDFTRHRGQPQYQKKARVNKADLLLALHEPTFPYTEEVLSRAYIDTREDKSFERPRVIIRIGEDHVAKVGAAAITYLKAGIAALTARAWHRDGDNAQTAEILHTSSGMPITMDDVELTELKNEAEKDMENIEIATSDKPGHTGDFKIGEHLERAIITMTKDYWDSIAAGKLHFQDMN